MLLKFLVSQSYTQFLISYSKLSSEQTFEKFYLYIWRSHVANSIVVVGPTRSLPCSVPLKKTVGVSERVYVYVYIYECTDIYMCTYVCVCIYICVLTRKEKNEKEWADRRARRRAACCWPQKQLVFLNVCIFIHM